MTPMPPATIVELFAYVSRCYRRGGGTTKGSKPTRLSSQSASLFTGADWSCQGGARREGGGGRGELPKPHGLPGCNPCPATATTSVRNLHHSHACLLCPSSTAALTTACYLPVGSAHVDGFAAAGEKRGEGREIAWPFRLPPECRLSIPDHARHRWHHVCQDPCRRW
jgi:hypothetical protein